MKYICELCGWIFDEEAGDPNHGIPAGTSFADLPQHYSCPLCGSEKEAFTKVEKQNKLQPAAQSDPTLWHNLKYSADRDQSER